MAETKAAFIKELQQDFTLLGELMKSKSTDEAWALAGTLNGKLKNEDNLKLLDGNVAVMVNGMIKDYYSANSGLNKAQKRMFAVGNSVLGKVGEIR